MKQHIVSYWKAVRRCKGASSVWDGKGNIYCGRLVHVAGASCTVRSNLAAWECILRLTFLCTLPQTAVSVICSRQLTVLQGGVLSVAGN